MVKIIMAFVSLILDVLPLPFFREVVHIDVC